MRVRLNQGKTQSLAVSFGPTPDSPSSIGNDNSAFIANSVNSVEYTTSWDGHALRRTFVMPFIQDEWKVTPTFTVNAGLRWEYYSPVTEAHDHVKIFDLQGCHGFCSPTSPLEYPNYKNFDPRLSIAWAPSRFHGKSVVPRRIRYLPWRRAERRPQCGPGKRSLGHDLPAECPLEF